MSVREKRVQNVNGTTGSINAGLTEDERRAWWDDGLVLRRNVLSMDEVDRLRHAADRITEPLWAAGPDPRYPDDHPHSVRRTSLVTVSDEFDTLIDHPNTLGVLRELLGAYVQLAGSEVFARRRSDRPISKFHTDFGPSLQRIYLAPDSLAIQLKIQFFLTDVDSDDQANFVFVPGSHRRPPRTVQDNCHVDEANSWMDQGRWPPEAISVRANAGDAIIFAPTLWHAVAANPSGKERLTVIMRYAQLWCRAHDESARAVQLRTLSPRRARFLGHLPEDADPMQYYKPKHQEAVAWPEFGAAGAWPSAPSSP